MLLFALNVNSISCLPFVQLVCAPELALLIFKFLTLSNSGKRPFGHSAAALFNCLDTDLKQIACASLSSTIFSSRLYNLKHKLLILLLKFACNISHLQELSFFRHVAGGWAGGGGGGSSPEIFRFELNSATKVECWSLKWTAVNGSYSFQVLSIIVRLCTVVLVCNMELCKSYFCSARDNQHICLFFIRNG